MKQPTLEEVKEYFKNAKTVISCYGENTELSEIVQGVRQSYKDKETGCTVYNDDTGKYAEILTYKEKTFSITESQIKEVNEFFLMHNSKESSDKWKEWYPEAFESEVKSLPKDYTGWCKIHNMGNDNWIMYFENGIQQYGIDSNGNWFNESGAKIHEHYSEATEQEVFEALKNEAEKRYIKGSFVGDFLQWNKGTIHEMFSSNQISDEEYRLCFKYNHLFKGNLMVFSDGVWIKTIPTITLSEAEQQLGKKIIV